MTSFTRTSSNIDKANNDNKTTHRRKTMWLIAFQSQSGEMHQYSVDSVNLEQVHIVQVRI